MYDKRLKERSDSVDTLDGVHLDVEFSRSYDVQDKLTSSKYSGDYVLDLEELTFQRIQEFGLSEPIRIKQKNGLGGYIFNSCSSTLFLRIYDETSRTLARNFTQPLVMIICV